MPVYTPRTTQQFDDVRQLMRDFLAWHRKRHASERRLVDSYFDDAAFEAELATLPGAYAAPFGALRIARIAGHAAGCVALRRVDAVTCEMKRMFVQPRFRGLGIGRMLATRIVQDGRRAGYRRMVLDTSIRQVEAQELYRSLGFVDTGPRDGLERELREWLVFMTLDLEPRT